MHSHAERWERVAHHTNQTMNTKLLSHSHYRRDEGNPTYNFDTLLSSQSLQSPTLTTPTI